MAHDEHLADRVREVLAARAGVRTLDGPGEWTEKRMFGGLALLLDGRMVVAVLGGAGGVGGAGGGSLLLRCTPERTAEHLLEPGASRFVMQGREVDGWLAVDGEVCEDGAVLASWLEVGLAYAETLTARGS